MCVCVKKHKYIITVSDPMSETISFESIGKELLNYIRWKITLFINLIHLEALYRFVINVPFAFSVFLFSGRTCM